MSRQYPIVNVASYTFNNWVQRTNDLVNIVNTGVVTVQTNTAGDLTVGNGFVVGIFGSNTITASTIRGGNVTSSNVLILSSNVNFTGSQSNVSSNVYFNASNLYFNTSNSIVLSGNTYLYSNTSQQILSVISNNTNYSVSINVNSGFTVQGNAVLQNSLQVGDAATFNDMISVAGRATLSNTLNLVGAANLQSSANIAGSLTVVGSSIFNSTLGIVGAASLSSSLDVSGNANFANLATFIGNASFVNTSTLYAYANNLNGNNVSFGNGAVSSNSSGLYATYYYSGVSNASSNGLIANSTSLSIGNTSLKTTLTPSKVSANTAEFYTLNITGQIVGTISPTSNFIPTPNNNLLVGTSANVFNQVYATNTYTNSIHSFTGVLTLHDSVNMLEPMGLNSISYISSKTYSFPNTSIQAIDSFPISTYRSAEYFIQFSDTTSTSFHVTKLVVYSDGISAYSSEFAQMFNNSSLGTITTDISGGNVRIMVTPAATTVVAKFSKNLMTV